MDRKRRLYWGRYARALADKMELRDWTVGTAHRPASEGANAEVNRTYGKKYAVIFLSPDFDARTPEENRLTMVHELIHCHFTGADQAVRDAAQNVPKRWVQQLECALTFHHEVAIAALADIIAPFMPMPPEPKKRKKKNP